MSDIEFINNTPKSLGDHMIKLGLRSISSYDQIAKKRILLLRSIDRESEYLTMINPVIKDGFVTLVVEPLDLAIERGARVHIVIEDVANYNDAANALQPDKNGRGILKALDDVFERTGIDYEDIDYINAHGTGTGAGDPTEINMMKAFFEEGTPISSLKGHIGHAMGSCGMVETVYTALMMKHGKIVHNYNTRKPIDNYFNVLLEPIEKEIKYVVKNSFGFGGRSSTAILSKYE